jgi:hypothetical protein
VLLLPSLTLLTSINLSDFDVVHAQQTNLDPLRVRWQQYLQAQEAKEPARLKPEQEHALRHQGIDEVRVTAPSTFSCGITRMIRIALSLDGMVSACATSSRSA